MGVELKGGGCDGGKRGIGGCNSRGIRRSGRRETCGSSRRGVGVVGEILEGVVGEEMVAMAWE